MKYIHMLLIIIFFWNLMIILKKRKKHKITKEKNIEIFNLGNSHSLVSFNYVNKNNINLGENSQTFYYDYIILKRYFNKLKNNGYCFLTISYFSFASKEYWLKEDLIKYYGILQIKNFHGIQKIDCMLYKYLPLVWSIRKKMMKKYENPDFIKRIKGHRKKLKENKMLNFNLELIEKIIKKCNEKSIKVILITTPFTKYYNSYFEKELLQKNYYEIVEKIRNKYNLLYFDFSHDYKNFNKKGYFEDYDHLSKEGSEIFKEILLKKLRDDNIRIIF